MKRWVRVLCGLLLLTLAASESFSAAFLKEGKQGSLNEVIKTIMDRRSIRQYTDRPVERAKLEVIARCGLAAPSPMNSQPWQIRIVTDPDFINGLTREFLKAHASASRDAGFKNMFRNAPVVIFIGAPANGSGDLACGMLGENMMIAAQALGLGTCALGGPVQFMKKYPGAKPYLEKLALPVNYELLYAIGVGYGAEKPGPRIRDADKLRFID